MTKYDGYGFSQTDTKADETTIVTLQSKFVYPTTFTQSADQSSTNYTPKKKFTAKLPSINYF